MEIPEIKRTSASDEVFKTLHDWILSGRVKPPDRLPSQDELAKHFGVSRNTLREAIYKLTVLGLLEAKQGVGTVVKLPTPSDYITSLSDHLLLNPTTVREFLEARFFVEKAIARLAASRATHEDIEEMGIIVDQQVKAFERQEISEFSKMDAEFHLALARSCKNTVLMKFLETIRDLLNKFIEEVSHLPDSIEKAIRFHRIILESIAERNEKGAEDGMVMHMQDVVRTISMYTPIELDAHPAFGMDE